MTGLARPAPRMSVEATTADDRVKRLITVLETLSHVLDHETQAVRRRDYTSLGPLSQQKSRLTDNYGEQLRDLSANAPAAGDLEPGLAQHFRQTLKRFLRLVESNARALNAAKTAHERFIKSISDAVAAKAQPVKGYSSAGTYGLKASSGRAGATPIALNQTV